MHLHILTVAQEMCPVNAVFVAMRSQGCIIICENTLHKITYEVMKMKQSKLPKQALIILGIALVLVVSTAIWSSAKITQDASEEMQSTLRDVATQNALIVQQEIRENFNLLYSLADEISLSPSAGNVNSIASLLGSFVSTYEFKRIGFISLDGQAVTTDGYVQDLSSRTFFKEGIQGLPGISNTLQDRIGASEPINVFSVPVYNQSNAISGVLFITYRNQQFEEILSVQSFNNQGFSCLLNQDGELIASSSNAPVSMQEATLMSDYLTADSRNDVPYQDLCALLRGSSSGSGYFYRDSQQYYYYAVPLDNLRSDRQWFALTIVPDQVLSSRSAPVLIQVRLLIFLIILIAGGGSFAYVHSIRMQRRQLFRLAYVDPLTNGDNFACFKEKMVRHNGDCGFYVALDLQDFKLINNTCGVAKGDETLKEVWQIIQSSTHLGEFSAHVNADRFILFLRDKDRRTLEPRLVCLCQDISNLSTKLNIPRLFPLCGVYETTDHREVDQNYGNAVQAKYLVKGKRNKHYAFYDELDIKQLSEDRLMEDIFEDALKNREFQLWYQPKVDPVRGNILGAEALIRWKRPDGTMLSPGKFIPLFEKNGNITTLDEYVFRTVCAQQQKWQQAGTKLYPISVNISRVSLYYSNVVDKYREILSFFDLNPKYVPLEITESATIDNSDISSLIEQFHEAGFTLLLDDFGSGYSSLSSLNIMHFDTIKLDKSLIDYIGDQNGEKLLLHITQLLQSFGMTITAEGVETSDQVEFLKNLHCDDIQGYFFSKPLPIDEFEDFARKHTGL